MKKSLITMWSAVMLCVLPAFAQVKLPPISESKLDNGLEVVVIENHELPIVWMRMVVKSGSSFDPNGKAGLANLTAGLLRKGTTGRKATEIADQIDFVGGSLSGSAGRDYSNITCTVLLRHLDIGLDLFSDIILHPAFDSLEFERDRQRLAASVMQQKDDPASLCEKAFARYLFGDHPYSQPEEGTESSLAALSFTDAKDFYNAYYRPNNAILIFAGDIEPAAAFAAAKRYFGSWQSAEIAKPQLAPCKNPEGYSIILVDKPDASQANIRFGRLGLTRDNPDYYPFLLMNYIMGASFTSRLNQAVRVAKGLTYDIRTQNEWNVMPGALFCATFTENDSTLIALRAAIDVIEKMRNEEVSDIEFNEARNFYTGYYPMTLETPEAVASEIVKIKLYGLPVSYIKDFTANIRKVTKADIKRAAAEFWDTKNMIISIVTKASAVESQLKSIGKVQTIPYDQL